MASKGQSQPRRTNRDLFRACVGGLAVLAMLACWTDAARAQEPIETTTELGITVTPEQVYDTITEQSDFWPAVRRCVASDELVGSEPAAREPAAEFFKRVNDHLVQRLFNEDNEIAIDLLHFTAERLRVFAIYRELRETLGNDDLLAELKLTWDQGRHKMVVAPENEKEAITAQTLGQVREKMAAKGVQPATVDLAMPQWQRLVEAQKRLDATGAGQAMLAFEVEVDAEASAAARLVPAVVAAADWAIITQEPGERLSKSAFLASWKSLGQYLGDEAANYFAAEGP